MGRSNSMAYGNVQDTEDPVRWRIFRPRKIGNELLFLYHAFTSLFQCAQPGEIPDKTENQAQRVNKVTSNPENDAIRTMHFGASSSSQLLLGPRGCSVRLSGLRQRIDVAT